MPQPSDIPCSMHHTLPITGTALGPPAASREKKKGLCAGDTSAPPPDFFHQPLMTLNVVRLLFRSHESSGCEKRWLNSSSSSRIGNSVWPDVCSQRLAETLHSSHRARSAQWVPGKRCPTRAPRDTRARSY